MSIKRSAIAPSAWSALDFGDLLDVITEREHKFPGSYLRRALAGLTILGDGRPVFLVDLNQLA